MPSSSGEGFGIFYSSEFPAQRGAFYGAIILCCCDDLRASWYVNAETYNIQVWPDDLDKVPCEAWKKNSDGSLTQTGTIVVANSHSVITGNTFTDAPTIRVVEKKCSAEFK